MPQQPTPLRWDMPGLTWNDPRLYWNGFTPEIPQNKVMAEDNRVSIVLTAEQKQAYEDAVAAAKAIFAVYGINLTPKERKSIQSIGFERAGMLDVFPQEMAANPTLVPGFVDMAEVMKDVNLLRELMVMRQSAATLIEAIDDIAKCGSADAFVAFTGFYANVKQARKRSVPGSDTVYSRVAPFFARTSNGTPAPENPPA